MQNTVLRLLVGVCVVGHALGGATGCAKTYAISWKTLPDFDVPYEKAWAVVLDTITEDFDLEVAEKDAGYARSSYKVEGNIKYRVVAKFSSKSPVKIKIKVDGEKHNPWDGKWYETGFPDKEREYLEEFEGRLRGIK